MLRAAFSSRGKGCAQCRGNVTRAQCCAERSAPAGREVRAGEQVVHEVAEKLRPPGHPGLAIDGSALGADSKSSIFYSRVKGELERDLRALGFTSLTLVRPGLIGGERNEVRRGERLALKVLGVLGPVLPRSWRINPASEIAKALVEAALAPQPGEHVVASSALAG